MEGKSESLPETRLIQGYLFHGDPQERGSTTIEGA